MSNIYLKVTIETFSKLRFSSFKKFATRSVFGELQLTLQLSRILLNKNINFNKNETEKKMENPTHSFERRTMCFSSSKNPY